MKVLIHLCVLFSLAALSSANGFHFNPSTLLRKLKLDGVLGNGVKQMEVDVKETVSSFIFGKMKSKPKQQLDVNSQSKQLGLGSFSIQSCGPKDQPVDIKSLNIQPDPLYFPGDVKFAFDVEFMKTINNAPDLDVEVNLDVHSGGQWIHIPCLGSIGSCPYKDLCGKLSQIDQCPPEFKTQGVPCKCPFPKGEYKLASLVEEIDASVFLPGDYRGNVTLTNQKGKNLLGCYRLTFTIG